MTSLAQIAVEIGHMRLRHAEELSAIQERCPHSWWPCHGPRRGAPPWFRHCSTCEAIEVVDRAEFERLRSLRGLDAAEFQPDPN